MLPEQDPVIVRCVLNRFDQDTINRAVGDYVTFPVKIFVNCKSSKKTTAKKEQDPKELEERRRAILRESVMTNDA